jgi:glutamine phosphoribosylpyrophosphate amidotransferase
MSRVIQLAKGNLLPFNAYLDVKDRNTLYNSLTIMQKLKLLLFDYTYITTAKPEGFVKETKIYAVRNSIGIYLSYRQTYGEVFLDPKG